MGSLNTLVNFLSKTVLSLFLLGVALVPLLYINSHECLHHQ